MTEWITLEELADYLKVSRAYLYKAAQTGKIPAVKVGRSWRFDREAIDSWLRQDSKKEGPKLEFPWSDCLEVFLRSIQKEFGNRFASLWIYGSWARGEASPESDVDLLVVLNSIQNFARNFETIISLAYKATFGRNHPVVFSTTLTDQKTFLHSLEPLLLNVRKEGKKAA